MDNLYFYQAGSAVIDYSLLCGGGVGSFTPITGLVARGLPELVPQREHTWSPVPSLTHRGVVQSPAVPPHHNDVLHGVFYLSLLFPFLSRLPSAVSVYQH